MKKLHDHLPIHMVLQLANAACEKYGFEKLTGAELNKMFTTNRILPPVIRRNANGMLWIDKWYIAVQLGAGDVQYLYLTRLHINEEVNSYRILKKTRGVEQKLPDDIMVQFKIAREWMLPTEQYIYFSEAAEALGLSWVSGWREATQKELRKLMFKIPIEKRSA